MHRGILALALAAFLTLPAQAEYTFRPFNSGGGGSGIGTVNGIVKGDGAGNPSAAVAGTDYVSPALTSGRIYVGSAGNLATGVPMGGDCTIVAAGTITCTKINGATIGTMALQNANAVAITGGTGAFTGTISSNASSPTLSLKTTQAGTREWRWAGAFNDPDSISLVDVTASNAQRLYINSSGNVGVGTISPSYRLDIADNRDAVTPARIFNSSAGTGAQAILTADNGTNKAYFGVRGTGSTVIGVLGQNDGELLADQSLAIVAGTVIKFASAGTVEQMRLNTTGLGIGTSAPAVQLHTTAGVRFAGLAGAGTVCASLDAAGNMGRTACGGTGLPGAGSLSQVVLNSGAGTGAWATEPFTNISLLTGVDCTGTVATVISTAISTIKSVALPTDCTLKITGNDTIPAGVFFAIPCGARVQVDGAAVLTFNAQTDDNTCQKFSASGVGAGAGGGIVKGLRFNRPEWWGAAGDCNYAAPCTHDDSGPLQQAFNSAQASNASSGGRAQVKFACGKGYGVSTGVVATATRNAPLLISGCAPLDGGNSEAGSALYGRTGFAGIVLTVTGNTTTNIEIRDFEISSINNFQADVCLQIGSAGNTLSNASGHSFAQNLRLSYCKHNLKFAGSVVSFQFDRIWMVMGNNGATSGANASCIEAVPNAEVLSELTFNSIACDGATNSDATAICLNFHSQGASGGISGTRINDVSCYQPTTGLLLQAEGASSIPDFWCYSCQMDGMRVNSRAFSLVTSGTATLADIVIDKSYSTNLAAPFDIFNIDGSAGGTIKNIGIYGPYIAVGGALRGFRVTDAQSVQIQGGRIGGTFTQQGALLNNCAGCMVNNHIFSGTVPVFALLGGSTDYSQACNNTASGALAPAAVSASVAAGTHNIYFGSGYQSCPNN